jgi:hypothetical protein
MSDFLMRHVPALIAGLIVGVYAGISGFVVAWVLHQRKFSWFCLLWCSIAGAALGLIASIPTLAFCLFRMIKNMQIELAQIAPEDNGIKNAELPLSPP